MCHTPRKQHYQKFLNEPLPIESGLKEAVREHFNNEIANESIESRQSAVDWLTWTFMYRRLDRNPYYYGLKSKGQEQLMEFVSEMVETAVDDLVAAKCVSASEEEDVLQPANLGRIASHYQVNTQTISSFNSRMESQHAETFGRAEMLSILCLAVEFE